MNNCVHIISVIRVVIDSRQQRPVLRVPFLPSPPFSVVLRGYTRTEYRFVSSRRGKKGGHEQVEWRAIVSITRERPVFNGAEDGGGDKEPGLSLSSLRESLPFVKSEWSPRFQGGRRLESLARVTPSLLND